MKFKSNYLARLIESKDKEGREWEVVLIQAGKSLNGKFYPPEVLKKALNLFEDARAYAYEFKGKLWNHLPETIRKVIPEGCIKNIVGWYDNQHYGSFQDNTGETQEGILARFHISENADWLRKFLKDAWEHGKKSLLGFSIDGDGEVDRDGIVRDIKSIEEVTIVSNPAAGGQLCRLLAGLDIIEEAQMEWFKKLYEFAKKIKESLIEGIDVEKMTTEQEVILIKGLLESEKFPPKEMKEDVSVFISELENKLIEMIEEGKVKEAVSYLKQLKSKITASVKPAAPAKPVTSTPAPAKVDDNDLDAKKKELDESIKQAQELIKETKQANCDAMLIKVLAESKLPEAIKEKVKEQFSGKVFEKVDLDKILDSERKTLDKLAESLGIKGLGDTKVEVIAAEEDKLQASLDKLLDPEAEVDAKLKESVGSGFKSIKEAYRAFNPNDPDITMGKSASRKNTKLTENIITTDFSYALGTSMTRKIGKEYKKIPFIFDSIVNKVPVSNFKQQEIVRWGGYSRLPTVAQRGTYGDLYEPHDEEATYTPGKKGGLVYVSRETIKNDDLRYILRIPKMVAQAGRDTLAYDIAYFLMANSTYTPSNTTWANTSFGNYAARNLSYDYLTDAGTAISGRVQRGTASAASTVTSATSTIITDSTAAYSTDALIGYYCRIVYGPGTGERQIILDNDATTITTAAWTATLTSSSKYEVSAAQADDEEIGLEMKAVIYGKQLKSKMKDLSGAEHNPEDAASTQPNEHKGIDKIYCPYLRGSTYQYYWIAVADKTQCDMFEVGYVDGKEEPEVLVADDPKIGSNLTADDIVYKVRHEYGYTMVDNAGLYLGAGTGV